MSGLSRGSGPTVYSQAASDDGGMFGARGVAGPRQTPTTHGHCWLGRAAQGADANKGGLATKARSPLALRNLTDPDHTTHNALVAAFVLWHCPNARAAVCRLQRAGTRHRYLPLKPVARLGPCSDDDCQCLPDYGHLARRLMLVGAFCGGGLPSNLQKVMIN